MKASRAASALLPLALAAGCATSWQRSYERWRAYKQVPGPYTRWALCIEDRSRHYLDLEASDAERTVPDRTRAQIFTHVLADCREHMAGEGWTYLRSDQGRRLVADAWQAFNAVGAQIRADREASII